MDQDKGDFIGQAALKAATKRTRLIGILCVAEPHIGAAIMLDGQTIGKVTAGATSPYLKQGIGIALMFKSGYPPDTAVSVGCVVQHSRRRHRAPTLPNPASPPQRSPGP